MRDYKKLTEEDKLKAIALFQEGNKVSWVADKLGLNRWTVFRFIQKHFNVDRVQELTTEIMRSKIIEERKTKTTREVAAKYNMTVRNVNEYTKNVSKELLYKRVKEASKKTKVSKKALKYVKKEDGNVEFTGWDNNKGKVRGNIGVSKPNKKIKNIKIQKEIKNKRILKQTKENRQFPTVSRKVRIDHKTELLIYPTSKKWSMTDEEIIKLYKK